MADIKVDILHEFDLTVFTIEGDLTADEIITHSSEYYLDKPTKYVLWDARNGTVQNISPDTFRKIANDMREITAKREGGKTAFVGNYDDDSDFGMGRIYEVFAEIENLPVSYRVFRDIEEAKKWLFQDESGFSS